METYLSVESLSNKLFNKKYFFSYALEVLGLINCPIRCHVAENIV